MFVSLELLISMCFQKKNIKIPEQVNDAISILSDGMVKGLFEDDGRPNVEVLLILLDANSIPILRTLICNNVFC